MSLLGRKTSLLEEASAVLREFQAVAEEPARERAQSFHRQQSGQEEEGKARARSSTFTQLQSREYRDKAREARGAQQGGRRDSRGGDNRHNSAPSEGRHLSSLKSASSLCGDSPANPGQFYEVLFLGKIKASHKRAPPSFIDEAIIKFQRREEEKEKDADEGKTVETTCHVGEHEITEEREEERHRSGPTDPLTTPANTSPPRTWEASNPILKVLHSSPHGGPVTVMGEPGCNKTMLLQVGRTDLRLISPDKRQVLLHKSFREISHCSCGTASPDCFGFICRDQATTGYLGFIFKCSSAEVVEDIMLCLRASFTAAHEAAMKDSVSKEVDQCEACPLVWFNHLCGELEGLAPARAQSLLLKRLETLEPAERESILAKMAGAETPVIADQNQVLMLLLKVSCEVRQETHKHSTSTGAGLTITLGGLQVASTPQPGIQSENVLEVAKRAKRSLADSFNTMVRRKASLDITQSAIDTIGIFSAKESPTSCSKPVWPGSVTNAERRLLEKSSSSPPPLAASPAGRRKVLDPLTPDKRGDFHCEVGPSPAGPRQRARTVGSAGGETMKRELARRKMARLREQAGGCTNPIKEEAEVEAPLARTAIFEKMGTQSPTHKGRQRTATQRQHIFQQVVTPGKPRHAAPASQAPRGPLDYRALWRKAIRQQILLIRMEKENQRILAHEEELAERRLKLDYTSLVQSSEATIQAWEAMLAPSATPPDRAALRTAVAAGVPRARRGEAWQLLASQSRAQAPSQTQYPALTKPYATLKSQLTAHQHAILIDLGRTFPSHPYFSGALGPGQLGLFNMLKAYSLLDPEVGYCQGLPFSAGMLLMHLEEEPAFRLLSHLLLGEGLREMFHPEMGGLQVAMYQLTRLLAETHPSLYRQLDLLGVDPSLYATPWFLTLFAAHFPLGFVARVFDLLFFEGADAIIKVSICLLVECENELLACESLEELMTVLKTSLPGLSAGKLEDVVRQAASLSIARQLHTYRVEYTVLREEEASKKSGVERAREQAEELTREVAELRRRVEEGEERERRLKEELKTREARERELEDKLRRTEERQERLMLMLGEGREDLPESVRARIDLALKKS